MDEVPDGKYATAGLFFRCRDLQQFAQGSLSKSTVILMLKKNDSIASFVNRKSSFHF